MAPGIWWAKFSQDGRNVNQLTPQLEADMGSGACFYDAVAYIEAVKDGAERVDAVPHAQHAQAEAPQPGD